MATTTESENVLRPADRTAKPKPAAKKGSAEEPAPKRRAAQQVIPEEVRRRFVQVGRRYHFQDGARAFTDRGTRLTSPSENTEVIKGLVQIAVARDWRTVRVTGTERFRKEAWMQAKLAGLEVQGYTPSEVEQTRLVRALARRKEEPPVAATKKRSRTTLDKAVAADSPEARQRDVLITGRLLDHGKAAYRHERGQPSSYFVTVETTRGERTLWGTDLERAIKESLTQVKVGEEVGLRVVGQDEVTVKPRRADTGAPAEGEELATHRNRWVIEQRDFFAVRSAAAELVRNPKVEPRDAVKQHPELASTYLHLKGAEEVAAKRIRDPEDQRKFVAVVRSSLADSVERGEPLQPVRLRTGAKEPAKTPPRDHDRDDPTR